MSVPSPPAVQLRLHEINDYIIRNFFFFFLNSGASLIQLLLCSNQLQHVSGLRWVPDISRVPDPSTARRPVSDRLRLIDNLMLTTIKTHLNRKMSVNRSVTVNLRPLIRTVQGVDGARLQPDAWGFCVRACRIS